MRNNGDYAKEKLDFLNRYFPYALGATHAKLQRHYVDLFAGPGFNQDPNTGEVFEGSPLLAIKAIGKGGGGAPFTHAHLINRHKTDHDELTRHVNAVWEAKAQRTPSTTTFLIPANANDEIGRIMDDIAKPAFAFVFADIEGPEDLAFDTVKRLRSDGHQSIDFYQLFPTSGIRRLIPYANPTQNAHILNRFFGTDQWLELFHRFPTDSQSLQRSAGLEELYVSQLKTIWDRVIWIRRVNMAGPSTSYRMILATNSEVAEKIASGVIAHTDRDGMQGLLRL